VNDVSSDPTTPLDVDHVISVAIEDGDARPLSISMVIPALNEAENLMETVPQAIAVLESMDVEYEVLVVDDGSTDGTPKVMRALCADFPQLRSIRLRRNAGKSAALAIGFDLARNDIFVMMDADGQDEPREIPKLVAKLDEGFDLVTGRRATRQDRFLKRHTSRLYNATTAWVSGVPMHDFNSGLKVLRREVAETVDLYGELHRYLPVLASWSGFSVTEVEVEHHPRLHGTTKYGIARFWRGFFDLATVKFITSYNRRPFHLFGGFGFLSAVVGTGLLIWMLIRHLMGLPVGNHPALITGVLFEVVAVQLLSFGLLGELIVYLNMRRGGDTPSPVEVTALVVETNPTPVRTQPDARPRARVDGEFLEGSLESALE
jgi:glycosyltransferase involved in cell wall biosynthesis